MIGGGGGRSDFFSLAYSCPNSLYSRWVCVCVDSAARVRVCVCVCVCVCVDSAARVCVCVCVWIARRGCMCVCVRAEEESARRERKTRGGDPGRHNIM